MDSLRWAALAWLALGCVLALPVALAEAPACPDGGQAAQPDAACVSPAPPPPPSPFVVFLSGGGILGSILLLRKA